MRNPAWVRKNRHMNTQMVLEFPLRSLFYTKSDKTADLYLIYGLQKSETAEYAEELVYWALTGLNTHWVKKSDKSDACLMDVTVILNINQTNPTISQTA